MEYVIIMLSFYSYFYFAKWRNYMLSKFTTFILLVVIFPTTLLAQNSGKKDWSEQNWGLGLAYRYATIPFSAEEKTVGSVVPMMFYQNDLFNLHGLEYGIKLYKTGDWLFSAIGRRHFFDAPKDVQNVLQGDNIDFGLQARYSLPYSLFLEGEIMSDIVIADDVWRGNPTTNLRLVHELGRKGLMFDSFFELKLKSESICHI